MVNFCIGRRSSNRRLKIKALKNKDLKRPDKAGFTRDLSSPLFQRSTAKKLEFFNFLELTLALKSHTALKKVANKSLCKPRLRPGPFSICPSRFTFRKLSSWMIEQQKNFAEKNMNKRSLARYFDKRTSKYTYLNNFDILNNMKDFSGFFYLPVKF